MKKFNEILKEIEKETAKISHVARAARAKAFESLEDARKAQSGGVWTNSETFKNSPAFLSYQNAIKKENDENEKNAIQEIKIKLLESNAKAAIFNEFLPLVVNVWNKYAGKKYGEKTKEKIRLELREVAGCFCYISTNYGGEIQITPTSNPENYHKFTKFNITVGGKTFDDGVKLLNDFNEIEKIDIEKMTIYYENCDYIENINEHAKKIIKAHQAAKKAEADFKDACKVFNSLTRGKMAHINEREGVKNWIV